MPAASHATENLPDEVFISYSRKDKEFVRRLDEELKRRGREAWVDWEGIRPTEEFMQAIYGAIESTDTFVFVLTPDSVASEVCGREIAHAVAHNKRMVPIVAREVEARAVPESLAKLNWIFCRDTDDLEKSIDSLIVAFDTDLDWVRAHTRLLTRAIEWEAKGRNNSFALRKDDLRAAEQWLAEAGTDKERQPTPLQTEYIMASRQVETRWQRTVRIWVSIAGAIAIVLAVVAWTQRTKAVAQGSLARNTAVQADFDLALTLRGDAATASPRMFPHLARALRVLPSAALPRRYLISLLRDKSWILPRTGPLRHEGAITAAAFSPDGGRIVTTSADHTARLWDVETGRALGAPSQHDWEVNSAAFSPDGHRIVTCSGREAWFWDATTGGAISKLSLGMGDLSSVQWSADEKRILIVTGDHTLCVFDAHTMKRIGEPLRVRSVSPDGMRALVKGHETDSFQFWNVETMQAIGTSLKEGENIERSDSNNLTAIFSAKGQRVVVLSGTVAWVWDGITGQPLGEQLRHAKKVEGAAFTLDARRLVTCSGEVVQIWDADTARPIGEPLLHTYAVYAASFNPDGTRLLTRESGNTAELWDGQSGERIGKGLTHEGDVNLAAFSPDGKRIVTGSDDKTARLWDAQTGEPIGEPLRHEAGVTIAAFSPKGESVLTASHDTAHVWEMPARPTENRPLPLGSSDAVIALSPDGRRLAIGSNDGPVRLCDSETGQRLRQMLGHEKQINAVVFSRDGHLLATGSKDNTARIWDAETGQQRGQPLAHDTEVEEISFSDDGKRMLTLDFNARLWDTETGKLLRILGPAYTTRVSRAMNMVRINSAILSPNGRRVLTFSNGKPEMSDVDTGEVVSKRLETIPRGVFSPDGNRILVHAPDGAMKTRIATAGERSGFSIHQKEATACFSPDGRQILTWSSDGTASLWDAETGQQFGETMRHKASVDFAAFTAGGAVVITRSSNSVRFWDAETGKAVSEPLPCRASLRSAVALPDGRHIATIGEDGNSQLWDVAVDLKSPLPSWVPELAEAVGGRRLDERSTLVAPGKSIIQLREELLGLKGDDFWSRFGRWFFKRGPERTISPDSQVTVGELERRGQVSR